MIVENQSIYYAYDFHQEFTAAEIQLSIDVYWQQQQPTEGKICFLFHHTENCLSKLFNTDPLAAFNGKMRLFLKV